MNANAIPSSPSKPPFPSPTQPARDLVGESAPTEAARERSLNQKLLDDWKWAFDMRSEGKFSDYSGKHVAIDHREIQGIGEDANTLLKEVASKLGVPENELVVMYID